jgi:hypothetical protein
VGCIKPSETNLLSAPTCQRGLLFRELTAKCIDSVTANHCKVLMIKI